MNLSAASAPAPLTPLLARTMSAQLCQHLRERILAGRYAGGTALLQDQIAAEFGVSKIPVREALVQLTAEGLVDTHAHRGFQVRSTSLAELEELFRLRTLLEPEAVALGARLAGDVAQDTARAALEALDAAIRAGSAEAGSRNRAFHLALVVPLQQPVMAEVLERLLTLSQRYVVHHLAVDGRARRALDEHAELLALWLGREIRRLKALVASHVRETLADLRKSLGASQVR